MADQKTTPLWKSNFLRSPTLVCAFHLPCEMLQTCMYTTFRVRAEMPKPKKRCILRIFKVKRCRSQKFAFQSNVVVSSFDALLDMQEGAFIAKQQ